MIGGGLSKDQFFLLPPSLPARKQRSKGLTANASRPQASRLTTSGARSATSRSQGVQIRLTTEHIPAPSGSFQFVSSGRGFDQGVGVVQMVVDKGLRAGIKS